MDKMPDSISDERGAHVVNPHEAGGFECVDCGSLDTDGGMLERCPECEACHQERLREDREEREAQARDELLADARWCEERGLPEMAACIRSGVAKGVLS